MALRPLPCMSPGRALLGLAAVLAGAPASAQAPAAAQPQALPQVQVYGTMDVAVGQVATQPPGPPNVPVPIERDRGVFNGGLQTSYIGFRGREDLGDGLVARFQIESFVRMDTGKTGRFDANASSGADTFWSREAFVALGNPLGELRLGNNAMPLWVTMVQTNALGSNSTFSPSFRQLFNNGARGRMEVDTAMVNSVKLALAMVAGVEGSLAVQAGEGSGPFSWSGALSYRAGPLLLAAATARIRHAAVPNLPGERDQATWLMGGSWDFGWARVFGQYTRIDNDRLGTRDTLPHFGATVPLAGGTVQFSTGRDKNTGGPVETTRTTSSLGYVFPLSKRTDLYTFLMQDKVPVGTAESYVAGMRHRF